MRVHHLNCGTLCPPLARLAVNPAGIMVCHCLLVETDAGLVLVDTGLGERDLAAPHQRLTREFMAFARPRLEPAETAIAHLGGLGFKPADVRHIVLTHLDIDHAGALSDFPAAQVHVFAGEHAAAMARSSRRERGRYRPVQWAHGVRWATHEVSRGEPWFGFECVRSLAGLPPEILLVPLVGHTRGHCGVAVQTAEGWLLHCGDAYFARGEMQPDPSCPFGLRLFQRMMAMDDRARRGNQDRLRALARDHAGEVRLFSAHDPDEYQAIAREATSRAAA